MDCNPAFAPPSSTASWRQNAYLPDFPGNLAAADCIFSSDMDFSLDARAKALIIMIKSAS
jgi:hypothetical protein